MTDEIKESAYYRFFKEACGPDEAWMVFNGYHDPLTITNVDDEARAGREATGLFDTSLLQKLKVTGPDAGLFLDSLLIRKVSSMKNDRVAYVATVDETGVLTEDGTLFRFDEEEFVLMTAVNLFEHARHLVEGFDVQIADVSDDICGLALFGPTSYSVLRSLGIEGVETLKAFQMGQFEWQGQKIRVSRTGFTGDLGYEVWMPSERGAAFGEAIVAARENYRIAFVGLNALDVLRMEAGYIIPGFDFPVPSADGDPATYRTPFDMGMDWLVQLDRDDFVGKAALEKIRADGARWQFASVELDTDECLGYGALYGTDLYNEAGEPVGRIGAGTYSANLGKNIGVATIEPELTTGSRVLVGDDRLPATVKQTPLYSTERRTQTPPAFYKN